MFVTAVPILYRRHYRHGLFCLSAIGKIGRSVTMGMNGPDGAGRAAVTIGEFSHGKTMDRILRIITKGLSAVFAMLMAGGLAGDLWAADLSDWPGPRLADPSQRIDCFENPTAELEVESPMADAAQTDDPIETTCLRASPLVATDSFKKRSEQLEQIARQADRRTRHGYELAARGAYFAARSEFIGALQLVAEGLDTERKGVVHSRALAAALCAMKEAEVFLPSGSRLEAELDLPDIIATHTTPVLKDHAGDVTSLVALRCYLTFAQEQFTVTAGNEVAGSMALHALGKLHAALAQKKGSPIVAPESKAVVFYQAALLTYPENSLAANDLGVLLAHCGRYADARVMFERSLALCPQSTGWRNLGVVYGQLGQTALAQQATRQAELLRQRELARRQTAPTSADGAVQWVDPQTFARNSTNPLNPRDSAPIASTTEPQARTTPVAQPQTVDAPAAQPMPKAVWPAPRPAAATRMSWGTSMYQR